MARIACLLNTLDAENLAALQGFLRRDDRDEPIAFVGRHGFVEKVRHRLARTREVRHSLSNGLFIQGAPGAGKTALLQHLGQVFGTDENTTIVFVEVDAFSEPLSFVAEFLRAYTRTSNISDIAGRSKGAATKAGVDLRLAQLGRDWVEQRQSIAELVNQGLSIWDVLSDTLEPPRDHTFILLVDETQRITEDSPGQGNKIAKRLHGGLTGHVTTLPVFAGLSDMAQALDRVGISRVAETIHALPALSAGESQEAVRAFIENESLGLRETFRLEDREVIIQALARASEGWPRHLHCYLKALGEAIVQESSRRKPRGTIDLNAILDAGHILRIDYCESRMRAAGLKKYARALIDMARRTQSDEVLNHQEIERTAIRTYGLSATEVEQHFDRAVHCGILEIDLNHGVDGDRVRFPMPSFANYLRAGGNRPKTLEALRFANQLDSEWNP